MKIKIVQVGYLQTNCYLIIKENKCLIVDPGDESEKIINNIGLLNPIGILLTHHHYDHVGAVKDLEKKYGIKTYDKNSFKEGINDIDDFIFEVIYTEGHTEDSITFYFKEEKVMFCGDFVFKDTVGRCDLPTGDFNQMLKSIEKIKQYNDEITFYPGHGDKTTMSYEKKNNEYFNYNS